jgi:hypothetical protein
LLVDAHQLEKRAKHKTVHARLVIRAQRLGFAVLTNPKTNNITLMRWRHAMLLEQHAPAKGAKCPASVSAHTVQLAVLKTTRWCMAGRGLASD